MLCCSDYHDPELETESFLFHLLTIPSWRQKLSK